MEEEPAGQVVDLMAALEQSVQKAQASRSQGEPATVREMPKKAAKTPAKKAPAQKTAKKPASRERA